MNEEINLKKMIRKLISLVVSALLLIVLMAIDIQKVQLVEGKYIIIAIVGSLILASFAILFKYFFFTKRFKYLYYQVIDFLFLLNVALLIIQLFFIFAYFPVSVNGSSMMLTLKQDDKLIIHSRSNVERADIVVLKVNEKINQLSFEVTDGELLVKRVIAVAGDTFYYNEDGTLILNGEIYNENYLKDESGKFMIGPGYETITRSFEFSDYATINGKNICKLGEECVVPEDYIFVLGDNRINSVDSRYLGLFHKSQVVGIVKFKKINIFSWERL